MLEHVIKKLTWLGHDGFRITSGGKVIYFDPFQLPPGQPPADIIFISHEHRDHCSPEDINKIQKVGTIFVTEHQAASKLTGRTIAVTPWQHLDVAGFSVEVLPAYNTDKKFHPQTNHWLGFVVTIEGVRVYHAGDTDYIPEMRDVQCDIALLPVSGTYVMTAEEAAKAALAINPAVAIPMHFDSVVGNREDAEQFGKLLEGKIRVIIPTVES